jgi:cysteine desulfurase
MPVAYLDNCATTAVCPEAAAAAMRAMTEIYGNPSSLHGMGVAAEELVRGARSGIARSLRCAPEEIYFTSGGTESNNLAVIGATHALRRRGSRIVTTMAEHPSVGRAADYLEKEGFEVIRLRPGRNGSVSADDLEKAINKETILVSVMLVNNETGAFQPVEAARRAIKAAGAPALVHCDAVQAYGRVRFSPATLGADLISVSAHKIHAPKGVGALYIARGTRIEPIVFGGGQEKGLRSGTEPVPAIAAFGEAVRIAFSGFDEYVPYIAQLRNKCREALLSIPGITVNSPENGAPHILNISCRGVRSETMLHFLESRGVYVSSGSACSRGRGSEVLRAMGLPQADIDSALRISFSRYSTGDDVSALAQAVAAGLNALAHVR